VSLRIEYLASQDLPSQGLGADAEVVVMMPFTDTQMAKRSAQLLSTRAGSVRGMVLCVHDDDRIGFVAMANRIFKATRSPWVAYVAQDAYAGRSWLEKAVQAMAPHHGLLGFNDGKWFGALAGFGLVRRSWALQNYAGDLFYPRYQQHYEDAELTVLAMQQGAYAYDADSVLIEVDWEKEQKLVHAADRDLYLERAKSGFDGRVVRPELLRLFA
jgi:hypothetical protein